MSLKTAAEEAEAAAAAAAEMDELGKRKFFPRVKHLINNKEWEDVRIDWLRGSMLIGSSAILIVALCKKILHDFYVNCRQLQVDHRQIETRLMLFLSSFLFCVSYRHVSEYELIL